MINNKIGGRNMVGRAVNRLAGRLTAVALTAAMAVSMLVDVLRVERIPRRQQRRSTSLLLWSR